MEKPVNTQVSALDKPELALPILDREALRRALAEGDIPTLLMVFTQLSRDESLLADFAPYIGSPYDGRSNELPAALAAQLRERLLALLTGASPVTDEPLTPELMKRMMSVDVGEPVTDEFIPLLMEQMGFEKPLPRRDRPGRAMPPEDFKVVVIGAGLTGLLAGIKLQEAGYRYQTFEKNHDVGGTWLENIYPGVGVDTPSHFYSYSFELNPEWSHYVPVGSEMQDYLLRVTEKYALRRHITFNTRVTGCEYDETVKRWRVAVENAAGCYSVEADAVINAHGPVNRWSLPDIAGLDAFAGVAMHTARWNPAVDLKGKRVALVGTGASAAQVGPAIAPEVAQLTVFQRSKHWVLPNARQPVSDGVRWAMRFIPHYAQWFRFRAYWFAADGLFANVQIDPDWPHQDRSVSAHNDAIREYCLASLRGQLEGRPDLLEKLTPDFPVFSKRIVMDIGWVAMMRRDNVALETAAIDRITADAIVTGDGRSIPVDVIVFATGFDVARMIGSLRVIGRGGRNLGEEWGAEDPRAYLGVTVPGYPNFFLTTGPNSAPNHAGGQNIVSETQINYILECLDVLVARGAKAMEPTRDAFSAFNAQVDRDLQGLIWTHPKANSYYRNSKGRVFLSNPYRLVDYWTMTRQPKIEDYHID
jgi:4-hydroxyacetophenone monooxygenase